MTANIIVWVVIHQFLSLYILHGRIARTALSVDMSLVKMPDKVPKFWIDGQTNNGIKMLPVLNYVAYFLY